MVGRPAQGRGGYWRGGDGAGAGRLEVGTGRRIKYGAVGRGCSGVRDRL